MEQFRAVYNEVQDLDRRQLISINYLKRWIVALVVVFLLINYIWSSIFSGMRDTHIPFALLPPELQQSELKLPFRSAEEIRNSQINQINFIIFACAFGNDEAGTSMNGSNEMFELNLVVKEAIRTMKSATLFTRKIIHFHVFTEDKLFPGFIAELDKWPNNILHRVTFEFHSANYPEAVIQGKKDKQTQENCDLSFLFIPNIVKDLDFAIHAKIGTIFLSPIDELWMNFRDYNLVNSLAVPIKQHNGYSKAIQTRKISRIESVFETSVIQYDMLRLQTSLFQVPVSRKLKFENQTWLPLNTEHFETVNMTWSPLMLLSIYNLFKPILVSPTVDLINIIAFFNPDKIYMLPCDWHFDMGTCNQCLNAKLLVQNEAADICLHDLEFQQLAQLFDDIDLKKYNLSKVIENIWSLKNSMYMQWPNYSRCSLLNANAIKFL